MYKYNTMGDVISIIENVGDGIFEIIIPGATEEGRLEGERRGISSSGGGIFGFGDVFSQLGQILKFFVTLFDFFFKILEKLLSKSDKILNTVGKFIDLFFVVIDELADRVLDGLNEFLNNIDDVLEFFGKIVDFFNSTIENFVNFVEILPKFIFNSFEIILTTADIANFVMFFIPALLMFFLTAKVLKSIQK